MNALVAAALTMLVFIAPAATARLVVNFRVRWIYTPGSEAWLVYDESREPDVAGAGLRDRALIVKVSHNFHF